MARSTNKILSALTDNDYDILASFLEPVELRHRMVLEEPNVPVEHIYFPASGVASVIAVSAGGERVEVGLFGQEGMSGLCVVNGSDRTPLTTIMQVPGEGVRIARASFETALSQQLAEGCLPAVQSGVHDPDGAHGAQQWAPHDRRAPRALAFDVA